MKVLIVCTKRGYASNGIPVAPFIYEQATYLESLGTEIDFFLINRGFRGYLKAINGIRKASKTINPDIIHAHYGLCGFIANLQRRIPVVTTFHGSDINNRGIRVFSIVSSLLSKRSIVVSDDLKNKLLKSNRIHVIPCGVNSDLLVPMGKEIARANLGCDIDEKLILFSKEFYNKVKNYPLARMSVDIYNEQKEQKDKARLLEFIDYTREQVTWLYNAVDCAIMTSDNEGSPQFIKEAMACNCPIVSVDVGDVKQVISGIDGCYLAERNPKDIAQKLDLAIKHGKTCGREKVLQVFDSSVIAQRVIAVYNEVLGNE